MVCWVLLKSGSFRGSAEVCLGTDQVCKGLLTSAGFCWGLLWSAGVC